MIPKNYDTASIDVSEVERMLNITIQSRAEAIVEKVKEQAIQSLTMELQMMATDVAFRVTNVLNHNDPGRRHFQMTLVMPVPELEK